MTDTPSTLTHNNPNALTVLMAVDGKKLAKRFQANGDVIPYGHAYWFTSGSRVIQTIEELFQVIKTIAEQEDSVAGLIRGAALPHLNTRKPHRRIKEHYEDVPRAWVMLDIDDLPLPDSVSPTSQEAVEQAIARLPPCFQGRDCVYHFSSRSGLSGQNFKGHLTFLLDDPLDSRTLRCWVRDYVNQDDELVRLDPALFNPVQIHFIAAPIFDDPAMDPFLGRSRVGLIRGSHRRVPTASIRHPPLPMAPARIPERLTMRHRRPLQVGGDWRTALSEIHDDRMGLHKGILYVVKRAVRLCDEGIDRTELFQAIRERVAQAVMIGELQRDSARIEREISEAELDRIFDWVVSKGYAIHFIERSKNPTFADALIQLETTARSENNGKHTIANLAFTAAVIGLGQCPARYSLQDMLQAVWNAGNGQLRNESWAIIEARVRERYQWLVKTTLSTRKIQRYQTVLIKNFDDVDITQPGIHLIKAPMGSGKTEKLARRVIEGTNGQSCVINHRISLSNDLATRLDLGYYKDAEPGQERGFAMCINSITKPELQLALKNSPAIVIDEFSQTLEHLATGTVERRAHVTNDLQKWLREKERLFLLDADLNDRDIYFVRQIVGNDRPLYIYEMPESWRGHTFKILPSSDVLMQAICRDLVQGEKVILAVDSKNSVRRLGQQIIEQIKATDKEKASGLRTLLIHAENGGDAQQKNFLAEPDVESCKYDLLIYSPAISSGISLTSGHFSRVYGLYHGIVTGSQFFQMLRRNRTVKEISIAYKPVSQKRFIESIEDRRQGYKKLRADMDISVPEDDLLSDLIWEVSHQHEQQQKNAFNRLVILAEDMGYQIVRVKTNVEDNFDLIEIDFDPMQRSQIQAAVNISEFEYETLKRKDLKTQAESYQIRRYRIQRALGLGQESPTDVDFDYIKNFGLSAPRNFELLRSDEEESRELIEKLPAAETWSHTETRRHRIAILEKLGVNTVDFSGEFVQEALKSAVLYIIENSQVINRLNITTPIVSSKDKNGSVDNEATLNAYKPRAIIKEFMRRLGLELDVRGGTAQYRRYSIDQDSLMRTWHYVTARGNIELPSQGPDRLSLRIPRGQKTNLVHVISPENLEILGQSTILKELANSRAGIKGRDLIELLKKQPTIPLTTRWLKTNLGLKDSKTVRQRINVWSSMQFQGLYRYEYKPIGIRGAGGRKQMALSMEADAERVKEHLERLLCTQISQVRRLAVPENACDLDRQKLPLRSSGRPPRGLDEAGQRAQDKHW